MAARKAINRCSFAENFVIGGAIKSVRFDRSNGLQKLTHASDRAACEVCKKGERREVCGLKCVEEPRASFRSVLFT